MHINYIFGVPTIPRRCPKLNGIMTTAFNFCPPCHTARQVVTLNAVKGPTIKVSHVQKLSPWTQWRVPRVKRKGQWDVSLTLNMTILCHPDACGSVLQLKMSIILGFPLNTKGEAVRFNALMGVASKPHYVTLSAVKGPTGKAQRTMGCFANAQHDKSAANQTHRHPERSEGSHNQTSNPKPPTHKTVQNSIK